MSFFKRWLRWQLRYLVNIAVCIILIVCFGSLAGSYWPEYAWGTTAIFALVVIVLSAWRG